MIALLLTVSALAQDLDRYPWAVQVEAPEKGVSSVVLHAPLRSEEEPNDGSDLLWVNGSGDRVALAVISGSAPQIEVTGKRGSQTTAGDLVFWPAPAPNTWIVWVPQRPIDALDIRLPNTPQAATVRVLQGDEEVGGGLVWRLPNGKSPPIAVPATTGEFTVEIEWHSREDPNALQFNGIRRTGAGLPDETWTLPVTSSRVREDGWARYDVALPHRLPLTAVHPMPVESLFDRQAKAIYPPPLSNPGSLPDLNNLYNAGDLRRLSLGGATVELTKLPVQGQRQDRVAVLVESKRLAPLVIDEVTVAMPGRAVLVRDPGPGPHTLYGGAPTGTTAPSELQFAAGELARIATAVPAPDTRSANAAYRAPEVRGGLGLPGAEVELRDFRFGRTVTGPAGLVRIPLDTDVLSEARADLGDLRLLDDDNRQIPYVIQSDGTLQDWGELPIERTERANESILRVKLPESNVHVGTVTVTTDAPIFRRQISVARPDGKNLQTLRVYSWVGEDRSTSLTLDLFQRFGDELVLRIENGDDPPLPVAAVSASWPSWSLLAVLPPDGARLVYGDRQLSRPEYDLYLLDDSLHARAQDGAALGEVETLTPPPLSFLDRALVFGGVGVMGFGLLLLTLALLRGVPEDEDGSMDPADPPDGPPDDPGSDATEETLAPA